MTNRWGQEQVAVAWPQGPTFGLCVVLAVEAFDQFHVDDASTDILDS